MVLKLLAGVTLLPLVSTLAQQASSGSTDWLTYLLNGGPFAIVVILIVLDKLTTPYERDRLRLELEASQEREATLNDNLRNEIVPALTRSIDALEATAATAQMLAEVADRLERLATNLERKSGGS